MFRRRTSWLLITLRWEEKRRLWLPVPIWAVAELLRGVRILLWCFPALTRFMRRHGLNALEGSVSMPLNELVATGLSLIESLRSYGPFTLVEVSGGSSAVSIRLV